MTISDIAKMAGVSSAAVSRYLNGGPLSEQKRAVIHEVVEKTGYRPDTAAQTLRTGKVNQVGVIAPSIGSQSVGQITAGIASELDAKSYLMLLGNTELDAQRCMQELLVRCPDLDGVVCVTDTVAFGAMRALREAGRHVGQDVGLAGVGDSWAGSMMEPGLATVRFYQKQVGQEAARILLQMLEENGSSGPVRQVTLGYQIVERGSL